MHDALAGPVVGVGEEHVPALGEGERVHGKPVVLGGDEAAARALVDARLVVATVPVPERTRSGGSHAVGGQVASHASLFPHYFTQNPELGPNLLLGAFQLHPVNRSAAGIPQRQEGAVHIVWP